MRLPPALLSLLLSVLVSCLEAAVFPPPGQPPVAEKPTLIGTVFEVWITDDQGSTQKDRLVFEDHVFSCALLTSAALGKIGYDEKPGATIDDPIPWSASAQDARGDRAVFRGRAEKDAISGTITLTPAQGPDHVFTMSGGKAGTDAARKPPAPK
jgi:hypothetical protein